MVLFKRRSMCSVSFCNYWILNLNFEYLQFVFGFHNYYNVLALNEILVLPLTTGKQNGIVRSIRGQSKISRAFL